MAAESARTACRHAAVTPSARHHVTSLDVTDTLLRVSPAVVLRRQHLARRRVRQLAVVDDGDAVHEHERDAGRVLMRLGERRLVGDGLQIDDDEIRPVAGLDAGRDPSGP